MAYKPIDPEDLRVAALESVYVLTRDNESAIIESDQVWCISCSRTFNAKRVTVFACGQGFCPHCGETGIVPDHSLPEDVDMTKTLFGELSEYFHMRGITDPESDFDEVSWIFVG
tara:strand:+ start:215402 stop:215743 length:342 start_codon:yes stop_codon:yes gene_type:complete